MNLEININGHTDIINFEKINQWCGFNIIEKERILTALSKYFSSSKQSDAEGQNISVKIDDNVIGRKYYKIIQINNRETLIDYIRNMKTGLVIRLIQNKLSSFDNEYKLEQIDSILLSVFADVNVSVLQELGPISLEYEKESLWSMIQKSEILTERGDSLDCLSSFELYNIFFNSLKQLQLLEPEKVMLIIKNPDHFLSVEEYNQILNKIGEATASFDITAIVSLSLPHYPVIKCDFMEGVTIFNKLIFSLPEVSHLLTFISSNYPMQKDFSEKDIINILKENVHYINYELAPISTVEALVVQKLINKSNQLDFPYVNWGKTPEIAYVSETIVV